ncbi:MAG: FAD-binding oxidoreductase [Gemmatimonadales bacterium]|nr:FAD-binding oxidoreductase [Gemmatimonadales bacterium]
MIPLSSEPVPSTADAVIVGAGINGLATAYELAGLGLKNIVVIEKDYIGSGSTGRCGGGIRQQWTTEENIRLAQESVRMYEGMSAELGYQVFFRQGGYLMVTESEDDLPALRKAVELQNICDVPTEFLQPDECLKIVPDLDISHIKGATFCPKDGTAYPFAVVWGYARACHRRGVKIFIRSKVTEVTADQGEIRSVVTDRGTISTPLLINCAGPWARSLAAMVGVKLPNRQERHEIMVSESLKPFLDPMVISISNGIYFSQSLRGEIVGGIGDPAEPQLEGPESFDTSSGLRFAVRFAKALLAYYPRAAQVKMMRQWAGMYDVTPDHRPILGGIPGLEGYFHICGFSGHGFMLGPVTGRRMAQFITTGRSDKIINSLSLDRFERGDIQTDAFVVG